MTYLPGCNSMQIELIEQLEESTSMFREPVPLSESRIHRMPTYTADFDRDLAHYRASGAEVVFSGLMKGAPVCWPDAVATLDLFRRIMPARSTMLPPP